MRNDLKMVVIGGALVLFAAAMIPQPQAADVVAIPGVFNIDSLLEIYPLGEEQNVRSEEIAWDSISSLHLVQVRESVPAHHHARHSENFWVVRGAGQLTLAGHKSKIKAGDLVHVPQGTSHAFHNLGSVPAVIVSVFSPGYDGKDRVLDDPQSK